MDEMSKHPNRFEQVLVHTGQHYDFDMSQVFFDELEIPTPDAFLNCGSGSHAVQTSNIMVSFERSVLKHTPDAVIVVGDVNSTLACALVCSKLGIRVVHVESGLRSRDRTMPEEINRLLTDQISDLLLTPSRDAIQNLLREGIDASRIVFVGNLMIDTLTKQLPRALQRNTLGRLGLSRRGYIVATLHRPSNVDNQTCLRSIMNALSELSKEITILFPAHPRTRDRIQSLGISRVGESFQMVPPMGYLDFIAIMNGAALAITDSGGVQEETTFLGIPCLTLRPSTERPLTIYEGTNRLVKNDSSEIIELSHECLRRHDFTPRRPELWDGRSAPRVIEALDKLESRQSP